MTSNQLPDPIAFLEGLLPGNPFAGEPPLPRFLLGTAVREEAKLGGHQLIDPMRPGCTAAETTILTRGILEDLARGFGGFGVLRQGKEYLEGGAKAAASVGRQDLAQQLDQIASELADVHTPEEAEVMAERLRMLEPDTWELAKRCTGALSPEAIARGKEVANKVMAGEMTLADAVQEVRGHTSSHNPGPEEEPHIDQLVERICGWCNTSLGMAKSGSGSPTHGICKSCMEQQLARARQKKEA